MLTKNKSESAAIRWAGFAVVLVLLLVFLQINRPAGAQPTSQEYLPPDVTVPDPSAPHTIPSGGATGSGATTPAGGSFMTPTGYPFAGSDNAVPPGQSPGGPGLSATPPGQTPGATGYPVMAPTNAPGAAGYFNAARGQTPGAQNYPGARGAMPTPTFPSAGQPSQQPARKDPIAILQTNKGPIVFRLFRKFAPMTVAHFTEIAQSGFYNGLVFHRVVPGQLIQTGCPQGNGSGYYTDPATKQPKFVGVESSPSLKHNAPGVVGLARFGRSPLSASSQFYITLSPQQSFDGLYTVFGGVISGMEVVNQIQQGDRIMSLTIQEQP